ncbi:MAG TPA: hypothetical protein VFD82_18585 [Planctomycetota bacterium]|nr:hypothetical protein [Planctomycetota bacterium]
MTTKPADRAPRRWLAAALLAVLALAAATGTCVLTYPQLEPDDYRFLMTIQDSADGRIGLLQASVLENRWDHLWWIEPTEAVRFFRPMLVGSYALDRALTGGTAAVMLGTNLLLHGAVVVLVALLAFRVVRTPWAAFAASVLYAAFAFHAETMWYVAGRNETLAALGFFGALLLHDGPSRTRRWLVLPCYAFALLSKELTIGLPILCMAWDVLVLGRHVTWRSALVHDRWLWLGHAAVAGGVFWLRSIAVPPGSGLVFPYFVVPWHPGFGGHVVTGVRNYLENLAIAQHTLPFMQPAHYAEFTTLGGTALGVAGLAALAFGLRRDRCARWAGLLVLVTWLPIAVVYLCERYLVLPAAGVALGVGLAFARARRWRWLAGAVLVAWIAHQATWQFRKNENISQRPRDATVLRHFLVPHAAALSQAKAVYLLDFPGGTVHAQFAAAQVRHALGNARLPVHVLTTYPMAAGRATGFDVARVDARTIELMSGAPFVVAERALFPCTPLRTGTIVDRPGAGVVAEVVAGDGEAVTRLRLRLAHPIAECVLLRWLPPTPFPAGRPHGVIAAGGRLVQLRP